MRELVEAAAAALARGEAVARVVVMQSFGSVPRTAGAAMLVRQDGGFVGTVGGGRLEAQCLIDAREALARRRTVVNRHDLSGQDAAGLGMICGGAVTMLVDPLLPEPANQALCRALGEALAARRKVLLLTLLGSGDQVTARQVVELEGPEPAGLPASARAQGARARAPFLLEDPTGLLLVEPVMVPDTLYLVGAGHVALPTAHLASRVGFRVVVLDDRAEFANLVRFPEAAEVRVVADYARGLFPPLGTSDFVVIVTRGTCTTRRPCWPPWRPAPATWA